MDPVTDEVISLRKKGDIEKINIAYLPDLFLCADDTPLRQPDMVAEFGYTGDTAAGDAVTLGTYTAPTATDEHTRILLSCMRRPHEIDDDMIPSKFSTKDYVHR